MRTLRLALPLLVAACHEGPGEAPASDAAPAEVPAADAAVPDAAPDAAAPDAAAPARGSRPRFAFPVHPEDRALIQRAPVFGVDHDPAEGRRIVCTNYAGLGFPGCYDGHDGTDFMLAGHFRTMDAGSARVVAAAGGLVTRVEDGHYDRCHGSLESVEVDCDGHEMRANLVELTHPGGFRTRYLHLLSGSPTVRVGARVACGEVIGRVGSSGRSTAPHLHFEVRDPADVAVDPFAGPETTPESLWVEQAGPGGLPADLCDAAWGPAPVDEERP